MYGLDLFSGIGGLTKALEGYIRPVAYCENERYAQSVLLSRMATGDLPVAPIWDDVVSLRGSELAVKPEIIYGVFPCQDISIAGRGAGLAGKRSGLFFEIARLVSEIRPRFVFLENVAGITDNGGVRVVGELAALGYDTRWITISASFVGAPHKRQRWFLLAHSNGKRLEGSGEYRADSRPLGEERQSNAAATQVLSSVWSVPISAAMGAPTRLPFWVDRVKSLGNSVCPQQAREAFERLLGVKK